ncbi:MAG TPA: YIP1 family protein [Gammaproteobacteria bacterium]|nr:YIP1 family protein [Gammaproteobacteria bacterium]
MGTSALSSLVNIFLEPKKALADVQGHTRWLWYPFLISVVVTTAFSVWYYLSVDMAWLVDQMIANMSDKMDPEKADAIRASMTRGRFLFGSLIGVPLVIGVIYVLQTVYLLLVSKLAGYEVQSFGKWFNFTAWTSLPNVLGTLASAIALLFSSGNQVSLYKTDVTSINTLLFHLPQSSTWFNTVQNLHLTLFWALGLMIFGFSRWTGRSLGKSAVVILAPYVVIYGIVIAVKLT